MPNLSTFLSQTAYLLHGLTFVGIVGTIAKAFEWADGGISEEGRMRLTLWLKNVPGTAQINAWASVFPGLIDRVFGRKAFSLKFVFRSIIASVVAVAIIEVLTLAIFGKKSIEASNGWVAEYETLAIFLLLAIPINCVPDYFSLLFSRFIVRRMAIRPTPVRVVLLLIIDSVISLAIPLVAICMIAPYLHIFGYLGMVDLYAHNFREAISMFWMVSSTYAYLLVENGGWGAFLRLYLFASLFTSIWVWLYVAGSVTIRVLHNVRVLWVRILPFLSIEDKPMQAIGKVAGLIAGIAYLFVLAGVWTAHHL